MVPQRPAHNTPAPCSPSRQKAAVVYAPKLASTPQSRQVVRYDGRPFAGFQYTLLPEKPLGRQTKKNSPPTVQGELERGLCLALGTSLEARGISRVRSPSRTDGGVGATGMRVGGQQGCRLTG